MLFHIYVSCDQQEKMCSCKWVIWLRRVSILPAKRSYTMLQPTDSLQRNRKNKCQWVSIYLFSTSFCKYTSSTVTQAWLWNLEAHKARNKWNKTHIPNLFCSANSLPYWPSLHEKLTYTYKNPPKSHILCITATHANTAIPFPLAFTTWFTVNCDLCFCTGYTYCAQKAFTTRRVRSLCPSLPLH